MPYRRFCTFQKFEVVKYFRKSGIILSFSPLPSCLNIREGFPGLEPCSAACSIIRDILFIGARQILFHRSSVGTGSDTSKGTGRPCSNLPRECQAAPAAIHVFDGCIFLLKKFCLFTLFYFKMYNRDVIPRPVELKFFLNPFDQNNLDSGATVLGLLVSIRLVQSNCDFRLWILNHYNEAQTRL